MGGYIVSFVPPTVSSTSVTSSSTRSVSPAPSVWSMTSSLRAEAYVQEFGRDLNNFSEIYRLPADEEELERLDRQHEIISEIMGKYVPPLPQVMAEDVPGERKAVLDLGCGSGAWIMEAALDFPHCNAVGIDLVPMQSPYMPSNCRSEVDDINLGLEHFYGDFNVVHCRFISAGIRDYAHMIDQISHVLRPGGLIDLTEWDFHCYDENHHRIELDVTTIEEPWFPRWMAYFKMAVQRRGGGVDAGTHIHDWVSRHARFEDVNYNEYFVPATPWRTENPIDLRIGAAVRDDIQVFLKSGRPLLLGSGVSEQLVNELQANAHKELTEDNTRHYIRVQSVYARKRHRLPYG
ncbi:S-adenosyl-L-methionine-dependent methyltransferase [Guyanagaster necrorhizus]|uniref:S-adenosyl-L-methionine-dependent methyltransferase n=1 Tax=Guyanagaster necrorhizus TaxID=856835 RepID=A0A9P8ASP3_9AGAR|nr:S-adenosyl-L-methionine-dependent methyltransferase [Guyanagaster necrorhizus MCA 3950]KAG7445072.1 S-adenosyl-L-methionine-dependent methyltransferase [Guyanagaster necrorhizus MCA 3950]